MTGRWPWTGLLVLLGLSLRLYHYARDPSMWHDEAALVVNVLGKGFGEFCGPLFLAEAAPPLFLAVEKAVTLLLGDGTYALRLFPFLASCAGLLLFVPVARRVLRAEAVPWAVLLYAFADQILWHSCEAKPYAVDVLVATFMAALFCLLHTGSLMLLLILVTCLAPFLIFLTYPSCFLYGGLLVALLPIVRRVRQPRAWVAYGTLGLTVLLSFGLLLLGPVHVQRNPTIEQCWEGSFPSWDRPWTVPLWSVLSSLEVYRYCCEPVGQLMAPLGLVGAVCLWRRGQRPLVVLLVLPILLAYLAALVRAYPYGGCRVLVYAGPALFLLIGEAVPGALAWLHVHMRPGTVLLIALLLTPVGLAVRNVVQPWPRADCAGAAAHVLAHRQPADGVTANHWEYRYYFRHLGPQFAPLEHPVTLSGQRLWMVLTDNSPERLQRLVRAYTPPGCRLAERHEFMRTLVLLFVRQEAPEAESPGSGPLDAPGRRTPGPV